MTVPLSPNARRPLFPRPHRQLLFAVALLVASCIGPQAALPNTPAAVRAPTSTSVAPTGTPSATIPQATAADPDPDPLVHLEAIAYQVQRMRGVQASGPFDVDALLLHELSTQAQAAFAAEWPDSSLARQAPLASVLGLEGIEVLAGPPMVFAAPDGTVSVRRGSLTDDDLTHAACALDRALVAQAFAEASPEALSLICPQDMDACLARQALIAGDAALLAEQWWRTFGEDPSVIPESPVQCSPSMPAAEGPALLAALLRFPAEQGLAFVRSLYLAGGWAAIDAAYGHPPVSSEQVLHPERYPDDVPRPLDPFDLAPALGPGWSTQDTDVLGEWRTLLTLRTKLEAEDAQKAAAGWDGDRYALLANPDQGTMAWLLLTRWDTVRDAHEFFGAFRTYGEARFGVPARTSTSLTWELPAGIASLHVGNDQTLWIQAPDAESADALRKASGFPIY